MFLTKANSGINCTNPMISQSAGDTGDTGEWGEARGGPRSWIGNMHYYGTLAPWHSRAASQVTLTTSCLPRVWCVGAPAHTRAQQWHLETRDKLCSDSSQIPPSSSIFIADTGYWIRQSPEHKNVLLARYLCSAQIIPAAKLVEYHVSWIPNIWNITELYFSRKWSRLNVSV